MKYKKDIKTKLHNYLMVNGKKFTCEVKTFKSFKFLQKNNKKNHKNLLKLALINAMPIIQIRQIKKNKRKSIKEFPYVLNKKNRISLAIKFIIKNTQNHLDKNFFKEILSFAKKENINLKTKETQQKLALAQKKYIFFRWFY